MNKKGLDFTFVMLILFALIAVIVLSIWSIHEKTNFGCYPWQEKSVSIDNNLTLNCKQLTEAIILNVVQDEDKSTNIFYCNGKEVRRNGNGYPYSIQDYKNAYVKRCFG